VTLGPGHSPSAAVRAIDVLQNRASLVATEFSLLGVGAALLVATGVAGLAQGPSAIPLGRQAVAVGAGLVTCGVLVVAIGHALDAGGCRTASRAMGRYLWPLVGLGALLAVAAWGSFALPWPGSAEGNGAVGGLGLVASAAGLVGVPVIAGLGLRALAAPAVAPPVPLAQLMQATSHTLTAGAVLLLVLCSLNDQLSVLGRHYVAAAVCTLAAHAMVWAGWLLRESRQMVRLLDATGTRLPGLVRCHRIASAATVGGLMVPGLLIFHALMTGREGGVVVAAALLVASNHAMRFAWVLTSFRRVPQAGSVDVGSPPR